MRWVRTRVLPEPAPATISSGLPSCTTALRCSGFRPSRNVSGSNRPCSDRSGPRSGSGISSSNSVVIGASSVRRASVNQPRLPSDGARALPDGNRSRKGRASLGFVLDDSEIERVLCVMAHPYDVDYGLAGTVANWTDSGIEVSYCMVTSGDAGGFDASVPREQIAGIREREQRAAAKEVGVSDVRFLGYPDGRLEVSLELRCAI